MGGVAVSRSRVYTTGDSDGSAWLYALNESDGKQVWKAKVGRAGRLGNVFRPAGPLATRRRIFLAIFAPGLDFFSPPTIQFLLQSLTHQE